MLVLQEAVVNWQPGQDIVVVTTAMKDSREWHQNEVRTIQRVYQLATGRVAVQITTPLQYRHVAHTAYQAEVGLLSRSIKIQGAEQDSEAVDPDRIARQTIFRQTRFGVTTPFLVPILN